ncbi:MAG: pyridoxal phosphate-dependent aminotransferase [Deltaproteobacteria bacterium]|jgi:aspartate/methionine/tyrosine aminotransferase|nr:pyridoxal phosphate-dependent aminotransferase [Deltaproteobacteria bacterium]MBW2543088.1 pyridoxal phosphate-dependent aminotransferase [Deltaproteobacteria bacterium]
MPPHFARRTAELRPFLAMEVMERAFEMERAGEDVIHLEIGEPDFPAHPAAARACIRAIEAGQTHYTDSRGLAELREAIAADHGRRFEVDVDPERIIVSNGTSSAMLLVFSLLVGEGDEVVLPSPHYPCYPNFVRMSGGVPVAILADPEAGYAMDVEAVRRALTPRTRAIVVSSPANPTGAVQSEETMRGLASLGVPIISDEIYDGLLYEGAKVTSALEITDDAYVLDGFSKRYAMTGYRLGYAIVPLASVRALQVMQQNLFISANCFVQHAGVAVLRDRSDALAEMLAAYTRRRRLLIDGLRELGFVIPVEPKGAFYVFADARAFDSDSLRLAYALLDRAKVGTTPGIDFGAAGEGWLRFSYANSEAAIETALERLAAALPSLR